IVGKNHTMKKMKVLKMSIGILIMVIIFVGYVIWDNYRIKVVQEDIFISNLPKELEGFQILQITDLHEKEFGKNQRRLIEKIDSIKHDVIIFTGDMLESTESTNYQPFYSILEGMEQPEHILFVPGNADPSSYEVTPTFGKAEFIKEVEARGGKFLESFIKIDKKGQSVYFVNFELAIIENPDRIGNINGTLQSPHYGNEQFMAYQHELWEQLMNESIFNPDNI